jgi:hypothetical protein
METKHGLKPFDPTQLGGPKIFGSVYGRIIIIILYFFNYFNMIILKINFKKIILKIISTIFLSIFSCLNGHWALILLSLEWVQSGGWRQIENN